MLTRHTCERLARDLPSITIPDMNGNPYLTRYFPFDEEKKHANIFLHYFHASDKDMSESGSLLFHNHTWRYSLSLILFGGYKEERKEKGGTITSKTFLPGSFNYISNSAFHRVDLLDDGCWTLFMTSWRGSKDARWEFWNRETNEYTDFEVMLKRMGKSVIIP
jgi:hypothetical protein